MTPFFLYVHYIDPHAPYEARTAARRPYHKELFDLVQTVTIYLTWNDWTNSTKDYDLYFYFGSPLQEVRKATVFRWDSRIRRRLFPTQLRKVECTGGPWHFYGDDGSYLRGVWTGGVPDDRAISRRLLTR